MARRQEKEIYSAMPKQNEFHSSPAKFRLYGGGAGGGKSHALLMEAIALCQEHPGSFGLILRRTYPELKMSLINRALEVLPKEAYKYSTSDHVLTWLPTNSKIQFGHLEHDKDKYRYQGAEFAFIGVDELTQFEEETIKYLWSRLRTSQKGIVPKFFATTNPGGVGHAWVKRLWIDQKLTEDEATAGLDISEFHFVPSLVSENPYINPEYVQNLKMLPENQRKMLLDGSWDVYLGKFFEDFIETTHVTARFDVPDSWKKYRSIDFGRTAPFACLWFAVDHDGNVFVYREYYKAGLDVDENAQAVVALSGDEKYDYTVIDSAVFAKTGFGETIGERLRRKGIEAIPAHKNRESGWAAVKQYLHYDADFEPRLKIMRNCPALIEEMKNSIYSERNQEDLNSDKPDHAVDALRYFIMTLRDRESKQMEEDKMHGVSPQMKALFSKKNKDKDTYSFKYTAN